MPSNKNSITLRNFGKHLKALRMAQNLKFREFSALTNVNTGDLVKYENGESGPNLITITKLAIGLKVHPRVLLDFNFEIDFSTGTE
jgi:transcriptional regulator with XRE-family HTH domain